MTKVEAFVEVNTTTKCDIKNILQIIIFPLFTYKVTKLGIWSVGIPFSWVFFLLGNCCRATQSTLIDKDCLDMLPAHSVHRKM
jgi:hypothetical protein